MKILPETISKLTDEIKNSLTSSSQKDSKNKEEFAERCGLVSISDKGSFTAMVGVHKDLPNVVIKVVPNYDMFLTFAQEMLNEEIHHPMFPEIYGIVQVGDHSIITVERIPNSAEELIGVVDSLDCGEDLGEPLYETFLSVVEEFLERHDKAMKDFHMENFRTRKDGSLCCIDPFWSHQRSK